MGRMGQMERHLAHNVILSLSKEGYLLGAGVVAGAGAGLPAGGLGVPLGAGATGAVGFGLGFSQ